MDENMKLIMAEFAKLNNRLTGIEDQITNLGERMTSLEERTTSLEERMTNLEERMTSVEERMTSVEERMTSVEKRMTSVEERTTSLEERTANIEEELIQVNSRLGMLELKADKSQDNYEKLEAYLLTIASDVKNGFYKSKHQFRLLEDQGNSIIKVLAYRELIPLN